MPATPRDFYRLQAADRICAHHRVQVNGNLVETEPRDVTGQLTVLVPAGSSRVRLWFARTPDRSLGWSLSATSAVILLWFSLFRRKLGSGTSY